MIKRIDVFDLNSNAICVCFMRIFATSGSTEPSVKLSASSTSPSVSDSVVLSCRAYRVPQGSGVLWVKRTPGEADVSIAQDATLTVLFQSTGRYSITSRQLPQRGYWYNMTITSECHKNDY